MMDKLQLSQEEVDWVQHPSSSDPEAGSRLAAEVIICAVEEFRELSKIGNIVNLSVPVAARRSPDDHRLVRPWMKYTCAVEVNELIRFFTTDKLDRWIRYAQFNVSPAQIRKTLNIPQPV